MAAHLNGCEAYKRGYFEENFTHLQALDYLTISKESFLRELKADCDEIGEGRNLGELKSYVLLQMLSTKLGGQFMFSALMIKMREMEL